MLENETVKDLLGGLLLIGVESADGLKLEAEVLVAPALVLLEHQLVGGDGQRERELGGAPSVGWDAPLS